MPDMMFQALDLTGLNETAEQVRAIVQEAKAEIEAELDSLDYAQPDGIYPEMTVGAVIGADETSQWSQRESEGTGSATVRSVQGAAVAWNQQLPVVTASDWAVSAATKNVAGDVVEVTPTAQYGRINYRGINIVSGHSYLCTLDYKILTSGSFSVYTSTNMQFTNVLGTVTGSDQWQHGAQILTANANNAGTNLLLNIQDNRASDWDTWSVKNIMLFDLTAMFGSGNEPTTVAEFERMYPAPYYPYSAPVLKPVQIAGIQSKDAQGGELDAIEWTAQTLRAAGSVRDELTVDELVTRVGAADASSAWVASVTTVNEHGIGYVSLTVDVTGPSFIDGLSSNLPISTGSFANSTQREFACNAATHMLYYRFPTTEPVTLANALADMQANNAECFYPLATPTTTPISPALPMTYKVQVGGSESIIVPDGELSAAPIITIAEPVNMSTELAQIWAAIEALQGSRGSALGSVRSDSDVSSTEVKEAPTMDERQTTERESEI